RPLRRYSFAGPPFFYAHVVQVSFLVSPILDNLNEELKMHVSAEKFFNISPCGSPYLLKFRSAFSDDDALLRWAFDVYRAIDLEPLRIAFIPTLGYDARHIRYFFARSSKDLFPHHLGGYRPRRLIGELVLSEDRLSLRQMLHDHIQQVG